MIDDMLVIDAVAHAYNVDPSNFVESAMGAVAGKIAYDVHVLCSPRDGDEWRLTPDQFLRKCDPEMLAWAFFAESHTDYACYHETPLFGFFKDGGSPRELGKAFRASTGRAWSYGAVQPWDTAAALEHLDQQLEEDGIIGIKFYPSDLWKGEVRRLRFDDEELVFPIFERAQQLGIRSIAIHKAVVMGGATPIDDFNVHDVETAARSFPDLQFEVVHGGWAFLDDTVMLAEFLPNVWVNLEATSAFLNFAPARFAHVIGRLLAAGAEDRILWATGAMAMHPHPLLEKFSKYAIPDDLAEGYGYPPLSDAVKRKILGENFARLHGLDVAALIENRPRDQLREAQDSGLAPPWSHAPVHAAV